LGLLTPIVLWLILGQVLGYPLLAQTRSFASTVVQGDFGLGYRVIGGFLWDAERGLLLLCLIGCAYAVWHAVQQHHWPRRLTWWVALPGLILAGLIVFSDITPRFVVYGRLVRPVVPFLALGAAVGLAAWTERREAASRWWVRPALVLVVALLAVANFAAPLRQQFVPQFRQRVADYLQGTSAIPGSPYGQAAVQDFWEGIPPVELPPHEELLRGAHPLQFRPFQYEGFAARDRQVLRQGDYAMRLVRLQGRPTLPMPFAGYPGPVRLTVVFPVGPIGVAQPLVVTGVPGQADLLYVRVVGEGRVVFGLESWGAQGVETAPVAVEAGRPHQITLNLGSLLPPDHEAWYQEHPEQAHLRTQVLILLDDRVVYSGRLSSYPAHPGTVTFGVNLVGGSVVAPTFHGELRGVESVRVDEIGGYVPGLAGHSLAAARGPEWEGRLGPIRLRIHIPDALENRPQPLLSMGELGTGSLLLVVRRPDGLQFGYDRLGSDLVLSPLIPADPGAAHEVDVFAPPLLPPAGAAIYERHPALQDVADWLYLRLNGRPAFRFAMEGDAAGGTVTVAANTVGSSAADGYFSGLLGGSRALGGAAFGRADLSFVHLPLFAEPEWDGYSGPLRLRLVWPKRSDGASQPLVVSGTTGSADFVYVQYLEDGRIRLGYDHWGRGGPVSEPLDVEPGAVQDLVVSHGGLLPPPGHLLYTTKPELGELRNRLYLALNGETVFNQPNRAHVARADTIMVGMNEAGGTSAGLEFGGRMLGVERVAPVDVLARLTSPHDLARPGAGGYPGPVRLVVRFPDPARRQTETGEPLVTTGRSGAGDFVLVQHAPDGTSRIGHDHWGAPVRWSEPVELAAQQDHEFIISHGGLLPPPDAPLYDEAPALRRLRDRLVVRWNGQTLLDGPAASHAASAGSIAYGANAIGGSTTGPTLRAQLRTVERVESADVRGVSAP
jgi:hypothetical protein